MEKLEGGDRALDSLDSISNTSLCDSPELVSTGSYSGKNWLALGAACNLYSGVPTAAELLIQKEYL